MTRLERKMAELVVGLDGGWSLWLGMLAELQSFIDESRAYGAQRFTSWPEGELRRLRVELDAAEARAAFAVDARRIVLETEDGQEPGEVVPLSERGESIADTLLERARRRAAYT